MIAIMINILSGKFNNTSRFPELNLIFHTCNTPTVTIYTIVLFSTVVTAIPIAIPMDDIRA